MAASAAVGHRTRALPSEAAARATCTRLVAGGRRSTDRGPAKALASSSWSGDGDGAGRRGRGELRRRRGPGEAVRRSDAGRPAHRQAAHSRQVDELRRRARGRCAWPGAAASTPAGGSTSDLDDPAADPPAVELDADHVPDAHLVPERVRDQVVEGLVDGRHVREHPDDQRLRRCQGAGDGWLRHAVGRHLRRAVERSEARSKHQLRPSADFRSSTRVVCSQVRSLSSRPKCP